MIRNRKIASQNLSNPYLYFQIKKPQKPYSNLVVHY
jgi:hypothetical protein